MSPVGLPAEEETSACLCIEIRKASTPVTPTLFPATRIKHSQHGLVLEPHTPLYIEKTEQVLPAKAKIDYDFLASQSAVTFCKLL